jgi:hypothetical protein
VVCRDLAWSCLGWVHFDIGRRARPRCSLLIALAVRVGDAEIVLGVLIEIFRRDPVVGYRRFPREGNVPIEYLMGAPPDLDVGAIAVEGLISLRRSLGLLEWPAAVIAPARTLIWSWSHDTWLVGVGFVRWADSRATWVIVCLFGLP